MAQIQKGDTFVNGQQVTDVRLNQLVDASTLLVGAITEQTPMTPATLEATDETIISDGGVLKKFQIGDIIQGNLPVVASTVTTGRVIAPANSDLIVSTNNGTTVTGKVFTSSNGVLVSVTSVQHGLSTGQIVQITASVSSYSGMYRITVTSVDAFTYTIPTTTPANPAASGTCSYIKRGAELVNGHMSVVGNQYVSGNSEIIGNENVTGNVEVTGNITRAGVPVQRRVDVAILTRELTSGLQHFYSSVSTWNDCFYNTITQTTPFVVNASAFTGVASSTGESIITLPAGTYEFEAQSSNASGGGTGSIVTRVRNDTTGVQLKKGNVGKCGGFANGESIVRHIVTFTTETNIKIQHMVSVQGTSNFPNSDGTSEQVFIVRITRYS